jgi:hypothetical protein
VACQRGKYGMPVFKNNLSGDDFRIVLMVKNVSGQRIKK